MTIFHDKESGKWYPATVSSERIEIMKQTHHSVSGPLHSTTFIPEDMESMPQDIGTNMATAIKRSEQIAATMSRTCLPALGMVYYSQFHGQNNDGAPA